jgi:pimeloyl-ACP methyl ester carboxylesterase
VTRLERVRYADRDGTQLAFRIAGDGHPLLCTFGTFGLACWDDERTGVFFDRLAEFSRLVFYDPRGCGRSDPIPPGQPQTVEDRVDDLLAVMDAAGMSQAFVLAGHDGGAVGMVLAATHPERVQGLILINTWARLLRADDYPFGIAKEESDALIEAHRTHFGTGFLLPIFFASQVSDPSARAWMAEMEQRDASRAQAILLTTQAQELDVREVLPSIRVPAMVVQSVGTLLAPLGGYVAQHVPDARFVEVPGIDHAVFLQPDPVVGLVEEFVTGTRTERMSDRILATVVFTDIVGSTLKAAEMGDYRWRELLDRHDAATGRIVTRFGGRVIKSTGDGALAIFDGPTRALKATSMLVHEAWVLGIALRAGVHTGEIELRGDDVGGVAVHICQRVSAAAAPNETWVSPTVKDLVAGSRIEFADRGEHDLKGVPGTWRLYSVTG